MNEPTSSRGYVLARRAQGERDLFVDLLLDDGSLREGVARLTASSSRRTGVTSLEPFVLYRYSFGRAARGGVLRVVEAVPLAAHAALLVDLTRTAAAGVIAAFSRELGVGFSETPEPFERYGAALRELERADAAQAGGVLVRFVLEGYEVAGNPLVLDACVRCGREAPGNAQVRVSAADGGTVCADCGHGALVLTSAGRRALRRVRSGDDAAFSEGMLVWLARALGAQTPRGARALRSVAEHWHGPRPTAVSATPRS